MAAAATAGAQTKEGVEFLKADVTSYERYLALYNTPQEYGGCQGCRFFMGCRGQCPGTAIDGDWRNRTEHCSSWLAAFELIERELSGQGVVPLSCDPCREEIEAEAIAGWAQGRNVPRRSSIRPPE